MKNINNENKKELNEEILKKEDFENKYLTLEDAHHFFNRRIFHYTYFQISLTQLQDWQKEGLFDIPENNINKKIYNFYELIWVRILQQLLQSKLDVKHIIDFRNSMNWISPDEQFLETNLTLFHQLLLINSFYMQDVSLVFSKDGNWRVVENKNLNGEAKSICIPIYQIAYKEMWNEELKQSFLDFAFRKENKEQFLQQLSSKVKITETPLLQYQKSKSVIENLVEIELLKNYSSEELEQLSHEIDCLAEILYTVLIEKR